MASKDAAEVRYGIAMSCKAEVDLEFVETFPAIADGDLCAQGTQHYVIEKIITIANINTDTPDRSTVLDG